MLTASRFPRLLLRIFGNGLSGAAARQLMPFLFAPLHYRRIDRINIGFAGLQMTAELHFSDAVARVWLRRILHRLQSGGHPVGAVLVEKWSARKAIALTMLVWGFVASATGLIHSAPEFYVMRFILGVTEAGFFPGVIAYLSHWYRAEDRAKAVALFMTAIPVSQAIAAPFSGCADGNQLAGDGRMGDGCLSSKAYNGRKVIAAAVSLIYLSDRPRDAKWLRER